MLIILLVLRYLLREVFFVSGVFSCECLILLLSKQNSHFYVRRRVA